MIISYAYRAIEKIIIIKCLVTKKCKKKVNYLNNIYSMLRTNNIFVVLITKSVKSIKKNGSWKENEVAGFVVFSQ